MYVMKLPDITSSNKEGTNLYRISISAGRSNSCMGPASTLSCRQFDVVCAMYILGHVLAYAEPNSCGNQIVYAVLLLLLLHTLLPNRGT